MTCPYCPMPMTGRKANHCGEPDCKQAWQRNRMRSYMQGRRVNGRDDYHEQVCVVCDATWTGAGKTQCCSRTCTNVMRYGGALERAERAKHSKRGAKNWITRTRRIALYERDAWTCHICGDEVNRLALVPALDAPTLDHVIARVRGGTDDDSNLHTAHFYCNSVKGARPLAMVITPMR